MVGEIEENQRFPNFYNSKNCEIEYIKSDIKKIKNFVVSDTETTLMGDTERELILYNTFDGKNHYYGYSKQDFFKSIKQIKKKLRMHKDKYLYVFFHNAEFDLTMIYNVEYLRKNGRWQKSRFIMLKDEKRKIIYLDSINILLFSVKKLGKLIGKQKIGNEVLISKEEFNKDRLLFGWQISKKYKDLLKRCQVDCEIVYNLLMIVFKKFGFGRTLASISYNYVLNKLAKQNIFIEKLNSEVNTVIKENNIYIGGRVDCFNYYYPDNVYCYDFNSLYPSVMVKEMYPKVIKNAVLSIDELKEFKGFVYVHNLEHNNFYSYIPIKLNNKLNHVNGIYTGWIQTDLLNFLIENELCYIDQHEFKAIGNFKEYCFSFNVIKKIYELRKKAKEENDKLNDYLCKILMNASYGKFAQNNIEQEIFNINEIPENLKGELIKISNSLYATKTKEEAAENTNFLIASLITSYARLYLYKAINEFSYYSDVLYCDTDSVFLTKKIPDSNCLVGKELGQLKLEWEGENFICFREKAYHVDFEKSELLKFKGIPKQYFNKIKIDKGQNILELDIRKIVKLKEALRRDLNPYTVIKQKRRYELFKFKRQITKNCFDTFPIFV
jgi:hypothetical protein